MKLLFLAFTRQQRQQEQQGGERAQRRMSQSDIQQGQREIMTTPCRIFTKGEVLPFRQVSYTDIPRASPPATTALPPYGQWVQGQISLSTALQAGHNMFLFFNDNRDNMNNGVNRRQRENVTR